jgi:aspartate aminotransferase-like enzyme
MNSREARLNGLQPCLVIGKDGWYMMETYPIPMVPGPVKVPDDVLAVYRHNFGSGDLEDEFLDLYNRTEANLQQIFNTRNKVVIQTGEGMLSLWGALKSCLLPGDHVLSISTGVFGSGIAEMARSIGAEVQLIEHGFDETIWKWDQIEAAMESIQPKMVTAVHCETPSGTLNPVAELGRLKQLYDVPLLYVDVVASLGGAPVIVDEWAIDLALGGSQKALSAPPNMAFIAVSERAWEIAVDVGYTGYDALVPFRTAQQDFYFPYTPYWHGTAALNAAAERLLREGLETSFKRHARVAEACREGIEALGLDLYPAPGAIQSPTVTAVKVPDSVSWAQLNARFRERGLAVGGSLGPISGKVFRLGHMGTQADGDLVARALEVIRIAL